MAAEQRIALLVPETAECFESLARGVQAFVQTQAGWVLRWYGDERIHPREIEKWAPAGIIANFESSRMIAALRKPGRAITCIDGSSATDVRIDHHAVGRMAAEHLLDRGFRNLACFTSDGASDRAREQGFLHTVERAGLDPASVGRGSVTKRQRTSRLGDLLGQLPQPTGVFAVNDRVGLAIAEIALDAGISVPGQVALVGAGNREALCLLCHPALSSVSIPYEQLGFEAARLLATRLSGSRPTLVIPACQPTAVIVRHSGSTIAICDAPAAEALRYIHQHARGRIDIVAIARRLHISRRNLEQRFRSAVGRTLLQEIHRVRIELAKQALLHTDEPMPKIAERCGFRNAVHLSVLFSRQTGTAPTQFRQRSRRRT